VEYTQDELSALLKERSGMDFGVVEELQPVERGASGRIVRLRIVGSKAVKVVGKELEIRRWLSPTHLYSSAFVVDKENVGNQGCRFVLKGAGWGHGVGLCQIGAAVMGERGYSYDSILGHYYPGAVIADVNTVL
jgi:SpoIID/LytB domain protein